MHGLKMKLCQDSGCPLGQDWRRYQSCAPDAVWVLAAEAG